MRLIAVLMPALFYAGAALAGEDGDWRALFNGRDLEGWISKVSGFAVGENPDALFRVESGALAIVYPPGPFNNRFGHLFYEEPFSHYRLRVEYRFVGEQVEDGPEWAFRNNGIMVHAQPPETMGLDQDFPDSIEVQLLGGDGSNARTTGNLCTPATSVVIEGERVHEHCIYSSSKTYHGDQWVTLEIEVRGGDVIRHLINGELVMEYSEPMLDELRPWSPTLRLESGYIALQAETHPTEFRKIEILELPTP